MDIAKARKKAKGKKRAAAAVKKPEKASSKTIKAAPTIRPKAKKPAPKKKKPEKKVSVVEEKEMAEAPVQHELVEEELAETQVPQGFMKEENPDISDLPWGSEMPELPDIQDEAPDIREPQSNEAHKSLPGDIVSSFKLVGGQEKMEPDAGIVHSEPLMEVSEQEPAGDSTGQALDAPVDIHGDRMEFLSFRLSNEEYGLELGKINEIIKPKPITEVPRMPHYVMGVLSLRGEIMPIFDLRERLGLPVTPATKLTRIIIAEENDRKAGLIVDSVWQVIKISKRSIEPPPSIMNRVDAEFIMGLGRFEQRKSSVRKVASQTETDEVEVEDIKDVVKHLVILLNLDKVIRI